MRIVRGVEKMQDVNVSVKLDGRLRRLAPVDKNVIKSDISEVVGRHSRLIKHGELKLHIKQHRQRFRQVPLFLCKARFWNNGTRVIANVGEYGIWQSVERALTRIEGKLIQEKERGLGF